MRRSLLALVVAALAVYGPTLSARAAESNVVASRYDVTIDVRPDGSLDVVERITLKVGSKAITWFERRVPDRRTDGLSNVVALIDGREAAPVSGGVGVRLRQRSGIDARWQFAPTANGARIFELRYRAEHVLARELAGLHLKWTALPEQHAYPIDVARVTLRAPEGTLAVAVSAEGGDIQPATSWRDGLVVSGTDLRANDRITLDVVFSAATIRPAEPAWAAALDRQQKLTPAFIAGGLTIVVIGVGVLLMVRMRASRQIDLTDVASWPAEEGDAAPAVAGALLNRGKTSGWLSLQAAFFKLVRDGGVVVTKTGERRRWRGPVFAVTPGSVGAMLPHEQWIMSGVTNAGVPAELRTLTTKLMQRQRGFHRSLHTEMMALGLLDADRVETARALNVAAVALVITAALTAVVLGVWFVPSLGGALLAIPAGLAVDAFVFALGAELLSRLSESGERAAARWRARVTELRQVIRAKGAGSSLRDFERWLPLAIAAGQGGRWLKAFDAQLIDGGGDIAWMKTMGSAADARASIAMVVAMSGASHSGGAGAGGGGGAGGGSSGAG